MSIADIAMVIGLRTKPQAIAVPMLIVSVFAPSHVVCVNALRKSSIAQADSSPAASAFFASAAMSSGVSPMIPIETRSIAVMRGSVSV